MKSLNTILYEDIVYNCDKLSSKQLQDKLFHYEIGLLAKHIQSRFPDRSVPQIASMLVEEMLDNKWDYRNYLNKKYGQRTSS